MLSNFFSFKETVHPQMKVTLFAQMFFPLSNPKGDVRQSAICHAVKVAVKIRKEFRGPACSVYCEDDYRQLCMTLYM